jgi:hypothetical protein
MGADLLAEGGADDVGYGIQHLRMGVEVVGAGDEAGHARAPSNTVEVAVATVSQLRQKIEGGEGRRFARLYDCYVPAQDSRMDDLSVPPAQLAGGIKPAVEDARGAIIPGGFRCWWKDDAGPREAPFDAPVVGHGRSVVQVVRHRHMYFPSVAMRRDIEDLWIGAGFDRAMPSAYSVV